MQKQKINVKIDAQVGEGTYSNMFMMAWSPSEFVLDFGRMMPGLPEAKIYSRVVTTPQHAKQFFNILKANIENYEKQHGTIKTYEKAGDKEIGFMSSGQNS